MQTPCIDLFALFVLYRIEGLNLTSVLTTAQQPMVRHDLQSSNATAGNHDTRESSKVEENLEAEPVAAMKLIQRAMVSLDVSLIIHS